MKKSLLLLFAVLSWTAASSQIYQFTTPYDTLTKNGDTLYYSIPVVDGIWEDAELCLIYQVDNSDMFEYLEAFSDGWNSLGQTPNTSSDCDADSFKIIIPKDSIVAWNVGGFINIAIVSTLDVDLSCTANHVKLRLTYGYCTFGTPVAIAHFSLSDTLFCPGDDAFVLSGTPAGGAFFGPGVTGNTFNPSNMLSGNYMIHYQTTDGIGCVTVDHQLMTVLSSPNIYDTTICPNTAANLHLGFPQDVLWFDNPSLMNSLDTSSYFLTPALTETTTYYVQGIVSDDYFTVTSFADTAAIQVDFDALVGDDRGGIAVTPDYVYFLADYGIARLNHSLDPASGVAFPMNDGLFSDLKSGNLLSLWNGTVVINDDFNAENYNVSAFQTLDSNLNYVSTLPLSQSILLGDYNAYGAVFSGFGFVILYSGVDYHFYLVNTSTGIVTNLGDSYYPNMYDSENWACWGIAEYDGSDYSVIYRDTDGDSLTRLNLTTGTTAAAAIFSDLSDCATIGYSPWDSTWFLHFEGGSQWFGTSETGVALNATDSIFMGPPVGFGCSSDVEVKINTVDLGPSDTTICTGESVVIYAGLGFYSYTWNGINNNWNVCFADTAGTYTVEVTDNIGCTLTDNITVYIDSCTGINKPEASLISIFPNPAQDFVNIEIPTNIFSENPIVSVVDAQGKIIMQEMIATSDNFFVYTLDVNNLNSGIYQLIVSDNNKRFAYRLIKQ